jgi:hypothetical protein
MSGVGTQHLSLAGAAIVQRVLEEHATPFVIILTEKISGGARLIYDPA